MEDRLRELGLQLGPAPTPAASYIPARRVGQLVWTSGAGANRDGTRHHLGRVGMEVSLDEAQESARMAVLNCLAAATTVLGPGEDIRSVVKMNGYVRSAPGFDQQHLALNGASDLLLDVFGDAGRHARAAVGVSELPFGISVEVELVLGVGDVIGRKDP